MNRAILMQTGRLAVLGPRAALVVAGLGSLWFELLMTRWFFGQNVVAYPGSERFQVGVSFVAALTMVQVAAGCIWRLMTIGRRPAPFRRSAVRYMDGIAGAAVVTAVLAAGLSVRLSLDQNNDSYFTMLFAGAAVTAAAFALAAFQARQFLIGALARDREATCLQAELDMVI